MNAPNASSTDRPNLVFILPDRLRRDCMACYGNDWIRSPHLNTLSEHSLVFEHCYVTQPVCAPARSSLVSGLYPPTAAMPVNRLIMPDHIQVVPEMVSQDYRKGYVGKWHLGNELAARRGFDHWTSTHDSWWTEYTDPADRLRFSDYHHFLLDRGIVPDQTHPGGSTFSGPLRASLPDQLQMATFVGSRAAEFIESSTECPFVLYVSTIEPHPPFTGPYNDLYDPDTLPVEETFCQYPDTSTLFNRLRAELFSRSVRDGIDLRQGEPAWRRLRANYWGNVKLVDDMVGTILAAIDRAGVADRTIVVFTSDHGDMVGTHGMLEMRTPYEEATRVPLLVHDPRLEHGHRVIEGNVSQIDLLPTLLELLGQPLPSALQGVSRAPLVRGEDTLAGNDVFVQHNGLGDRNLAAECADHDWSLEKLADLNYLNSQPWRSVVSADRWKLNLCAVDQGELYDLNTDPLEQANLSDQPEHRDRVRSLAARLRLWQHRVGDTASLPSIG